MEIFMWFKKWMGPAIVISILFAFSPALAAADSEIKWYSYQSGMKKINDENKKGFLHFYTDWCTYCKLMNRQTFTDDAVVAFLNQNFVPIRVNAEKQREVAKKYGVSKFPNSWFIAEDKSEIGERPGFISADILLKMLKYVDTDSFQEMSFKDFVNDAQ